MRFDVSEIKTFRHCKRQWQLSSRNKFHLRPSIPQPALKLGTVFHESLHKLYSGRDFDHVAEFINNEMDGDEKAKVMLLSMAKGYNENVLADDLKRYKVLEIEYHFSINPREMLDDAHFSELMHGMSSGWITDVDIVGSIDMVVLDTTDNTICGFEHKTAKNFRNDVYLWMDEQPRVYTAALIKFTEEYNKKNRTTAKVGGIFINEVRKLVRTFEYKRSTLEYRYDDLQNFLLAFCTSCAECHRHVIDKHAIALPTPDFMSCQLCAYNQVCQKLQYQDITLESVQKTFPGEYEVRERDHLEDK